MSDGVFYFSRPVAGAWAPAERPSELHLDYSRPPANAGKHLRLDQWAERALAVKKPASGRALLGRRHARGFPAAGVARVGEFLLHPIAVSADFGEDERRAQAALLASNRTELRRMARFIDAQHDTETLGSPGMHSFARARRCVGRLADSHREKSPKRGPFLLNGRPLSAFARQGDARPAGARAPWIPRSSGARSRWFRPTAASSSRSPKATRYRGPAAVWRPARRQDQGACREPWPKPTTAASPRPLTI